MTVSGRRLEAHLLLLGSVLGQVANWADITLRCNERISELGKDSPIKDSLRHAFERSFATPKKGGRLVPGGDVRFLFDVAGATNPHDAVIDDEAVFEGQLTATNES
jgi:hypothetical protein